MSKPGTSKQAADKATDAYWREYFKGSGYGAELVREIPRRVAQAFAAHLKKSASKGQIKGRVQVVPLAWAPTATGGMTFEGALRSNHVTNGQSRTIIQLFAADFDPSANLTKLERLSA